MLPLGPNNVLLIMNDTCPQRVGGHGNCLQVAVAAATAGMAAASGELLQVAVVVLAGGGGGKCQLPADTTSGAGGEGGDEC